MNKSYYIIVRTQFDGIHQWKDCPFLEVSFLKEPHRHTFIVTAKIQVIHSDRAVEFIKIKRDIDCFISSRYKGLIKNLGSRSCEMIAEEIGRYLITALEYKVTSVYVSEDGFLDGGVEFS